MSLRSPLEDFLRTTMAAVPGYWQKLVYLADLRSSGKKYDHWGMARRYGLTASHSAISAAHSELFLEVLRSPIKSLVEDVGVSATPQELTAREFVENLWRTRGRMVPTDLGGGSVKHFELTLLTLGRIVDAQVNATRPDE